MGFDLHSRRFGGKDFVDGFRLGGICLLDLRSFEGEVYGVVR